MGSPRTSPRTLPAWSALCARGDRLVVDVGFPSVSLPVEVALWSGLTQQQSGIVGHGDRADRAADGAASRRQIARQPRDRRGPRLHRRLARLRRADSEGDWHDVAAVASRSRAARSCSSTCCASTPPAIATAPIPTSTAPPRARPTRSSPRWSRRRPTRAGSCYPITVTWPTAATAARSARFARSKAASPGPASRRGSSGGVRSTSPTSRARSPTRPARTSTRAGTPGCRSAPRSPRRSPVTRRFRRSRCAAARSRCS